MSYRVYPKHGIIGLEFSAIQLVARISSAAIVSTVTNTELLMESPNSTFYEYEFSLNVPSDWPGEDLIKLQK